MLFNSHFVKVSQLLLKSAQQQLYPIASSLWEKLDEKKSHLVISEILGLFVNTLFADDQYFPYIRQKLPQPIQLQLSKKAKYFLNFLLNSLNVHQIFNFLFFKNMSFIAEFFSKIFDCKRRGSLNILRTPLNIQDAKGSQTLVKSPGQPFFIMLFCHYEKNWVGKRLSQWYLKS